MRVAVVGGGIQGSCVAMELSRQGVAVDLIEANPSLMQEASRNNEGKIHLGFVYANDRSLHTARLMARAAGEFAPLMRRWLGPTFDELATSTPFIYAVHEDSLLTSEELQVMYRAISKLIQETISSDDYFGIEDAHSVERLMASEHEYGPAIDAAFATREIAIDPRLAADLIVKVISDNEGISVKTDTTVTSVRADRRVIEVQSPEGQTEILGPYDHIINCSWRSRLDLDTKAGLIAEPPWTFRMKYSLWSPRTHPPLPSTTVVLGSFGDITDYGPGGHYLNWYSSGRLGWTNNLVPPPWPSRPDSELGAQVASGTISNLASVVPRIEDLRSELLDDSDVRGGVIFSRGDTDVDDPDSMFHRRSNVGVRSTGNYHSIDTGKYTSAPLFAVEVASRVLSSR